MARVWNEPVRSSNRRERTLAFDAMEDRILLSAARAHPARGAWRGGFGQPLAGDTTGALLSNGRRMGEPDKPSVTDGARFVVNTVNQGRSMAYSREVRSVGFNFAKLSVSHDTRKVGAAYIRAALQGNGKTINHLNDTQLVKKVGRDFEQLSRSRNVRRVGDAFAAFGRGVARQFNRLFGIDQEPARPKPRAR